MQQRGPTTTATTGSTGPKAGGPRTLHRFATERTYTVDTTAAGGNTTLVSLSEEEG